MNKNNFISFIVLLSLLAVFFIYVDAVPEGPTGVTYINTTRHNATAAALQSGNKAAQAGNVTYLNISAIGITKTWAAYYGNISGTLVLENYYGYRVYSWEMASPGGKLFASQNGTINWNDILCWNWSAAVAEGLSAAEWDSYWNVSSDAYDRISETFNGSYHYTNFSVGSIQFYEDGTNDGEADLCPAVQLYNESGSASPTSNQYEEVILQLKAVGTSNNFNATNLVYMSLIEKDGMGFDGTQVDFQLIVPNDQHGANTAATPYYFYVELEAS